MGTDRHRQIVSVVKPKAVYCDDEGNEHNLPYYASTQEVDPQWPPPQEEVEAEIKYMAQQRERVENLEKYLSHKLRLNDARLSTKPSCVTIERTWGCLPFHAYASTG